MRWRFLQKFKRMEKTEEKGSMLTEAELKEEKALVADLLKK